MVARNPLSVQAMNDKITNAPQFMVNIHTDTNEKFTCKASPANFPNKKTHTLIDIEKKLK